MQIKLNLVVRLLLIGLLTEDDDGVFLFHCRLYLSHVSVETCARIEYNREVIMPKSDCIIESEHARAIDTSLVSIVLMEDQIEEKCRDMNKYRHT